MQKQKISNYQKSIIMVGKKLWEHTHLNCVYLEKICEVFTNQLLEFRDQNSIPIISYRTENLPQKKLI